MSTVKELEPAGEFNTTKNFNFEFEGVDRAHESYSGITGSLSLNYYLKVVISRNLSPNIVKQIEFWQRNYQKPPENSGNIKMEVGIEDCLHIEFEYNKSK